MKTLAMVDLPCW